MQQIKINKAEFKAIVEENKKKHEEAFDEAIKAFYGQLHIDAQVIAEELQSEQINFQDASYKFRDRSQPQGHCDEYQNVLDQLEYEVEDTITLTSEEFDQYIKDDWQWKRSFAASYASNTGKVL